MSSYCFSALQSAFSDDCIANVGSCMDSCSVDDKPNTCDDLEEFIENGCASKCPPCVFKAAMELMECRKIIFQFGFSFVMFTFYNIFMFS